MSNTYIILQYTINALNTITYFVPKNDQKLEIKLISSIHLVGVELTQRKAKKTLIINQ